MVNTYSKSLHFGRKLWGEFEKPTPEVPILATVSFSADPIIRTLDKWETSVALEQRRETTRRL